MAAGLADRTADSGIADQSPGDSNSRRERDAGSAAVIDSIGIRERAAFAASSDRASV
jgi:hypothetical protein